MGAAPEALMEKSDPCPRCGGVDVKVFGFLGIAWFVRCKSCGAEARKCVDPCAAHRAWEEKFTGERAPWRDANPPTDDVSAAITTALEAVKKEPEVVLRLEWRIDFENPTDVVAKGPGRSGRLRCFLFGGNWYRHCGTVPHKTWQGAALETEQKLLADALDVVAVLG